MDEKNKLYVFEKKEVFLLFLFMILIGVTSFVLGVRIGKNYSYNTSGLTTEDRKNVDFLSSEEEHVQQVVKEQITKDFNDPVEKRELIEDVNKAAEAKLLEAMKEDSGKKIETSKESVADEAASDVESGQAPSDSEETKEKVSAKPLDEAALALLKKKDQFSGKFTIQLGSHRSFGEAETFAKGFKVRGYDPIINEVNLGAQGARFRVSLGAFETVQEAKEYIVKEKSLFMGTDYVVVRFD